MKIVNTGNTYRLYGDDLKSYDKLPAQCYTVRCSQMSGFYLEKHADINVNEDKIYGCHLEKIDKVLRNFNAFKRNLGVILSGDKGIGKSLFAKLLAVKAIEQGLPLIIVDSFIPGIASYIESIEQEVVVLFDEFDKTFGNIRSAENETEAQSSMLTLFDGLAQGKKLFVITCNELRKVSDYLVNRPGRFHYHFRFEYPTDAEIEEYLKDKIETEYYDEIPKVISFSKKVQINYDCLRAIAFELSTGIPFETAIKDLNIINLDSERYNIYLYFENNTRLRYTNAYLDLFSDDETCDIELYDNKSHNVVDVEFNTSDCVMDNTTGRLLVMAENLNLTYIDYYKDEVEALKQSKPLYLVIERKVEKGIHYRV